jgi:hypothetical protein
MFSIGQKTRIILLALFLSQIYFTMANDEAIDMEQLKVESEQLFSSIKAGHIVKMEGLDQLLNNTDLTYLVYYYKPTSRNSIHGGQFLKSISEKLDYLAGFLLVNCETVIPQDLEICKKDPEAKDGYPKMELYVPPEYKFNPYTKKVNKYIRKVYDKMEVSETHIYNFITNNIPARSIKVTSENVENFLSNIEFNKVLLFTDKPKTPLLFRGLSNWFYDRILFGEVHQDQLELIKRFKVGQFPTLIVYQSHEDEIHLDETIIEYYKGKINAKDVHDFIEPYALKEKLYNRANKVKDPEALKYKVAFKKIEPSDLLSYLDKFKERRFVVWASKGGDVPEDIKRFNKETNGFFHFVQLNCEEEGVCQKILPIKELPSLLLLNKGKFPNTETRVQAARRLSHEYNDIVKEIQSEFFAELKDANPQNFPQIANDARINKRTPFVYLYSEGEISLGYYLVAYEAKYKNLVDFVVYENPPPEFMKNLQAKSSELPKMIALLQDETNPGSARIIQYNEDLVYFRLKNFIDIVR